MKKKFIFAVLVAVAVVTFSLFAFSSCNMGNNSSSTQNVTITLAEKEISIQEGESKKLTVSIKPVDAVDKTVTWKSDDEKIATVSDGTIKAVSVGQTTITVTSNGKSATCKVTVKPKGDLPMSSSGSSAEDSADPSDSSSGSSSN